MEQTEVPGKGILYTYSTVHVPIAGLENEAPYTVAIVELNGGCRVTGRLVKGSSEKLSIGAAVELV
ncbi:OB-fold domain-containing protein, partial [Desulfobacterota bacterium AH_259_B03_O07]|nr:OB-fold domain-containing protein [Desulfobacterota bacterium AH_259_B03_O07]